MTQKPIEQQPLVQMQPIQQQQQQIQYVQAQPQPQQIQYVQAQPQGFAQYQAPPPGYTAITLEPGQQPPTGAIPVQYVYQQPPANVDVPQDIDEPKDVESKEDKPVKTKTKVIKQTVVVRHPLRLGCRPTMCFCRRCGKVRQTIVHLEPGGATWCAFLGCVLCGCWAGCCILPFFMDELKDAYHHCSKCGALVGVTYK
mmetsp:Transcript_107698/g.131416  ORF Transcript_107698/g.131416 Transcript_107698/m.131416 type:complete len:198 (-) Transcript_107698:140-733(-)